MSPSLQQTEKTLAEIQLSDEIRARLDAYLSTYQDLNEQLAMIQDALGIEKSKIGKILADHGYNNVNTETFSLYWTRGSHSSSLNKQKLIAQGVTLAQIEAATVSRPKKDFFTIREKGKTSAVTAAIEAEENGD